MVTLQQENGWSLSDKLAVALACLAAVTALILFWIDKTPLTAGISIACIAVLMIYPIIHFVRSRALRIVTFIVAALLVGVFGYKVWPFSSNVPPSLVEKGPQVEPKPVPKSAAPSLAESVRLITNTELRQDVKELSDNMRDFETDARQKSKALMSQTRIFVNGQPTDEASWKERVKQNSMFHATEQTDFRKRYRIALRKGTLDSAPDLDVLLLAKELGAGVVAADEGIKVWAERLGLRFLSAKSFPKMMEEYLQYYD